jgi:hypothetical protein
MMAMVTVAWVAMLAMGRVDQLAMFAIGGVKRLPGTVLVVRDISLVLYLLWCQREFYPEFDEPGRRPFVYGEGIIGRRRGERRAPPDDRRSGSTIADDNKGSAIRARADDATAGDLGNDHYVRGNARGRRRHPVHRKEFGCHPRALDLFMDRVIETFPHFLAPVYFLAPAVGH